MITINYTLNLFCPHCETEAECQVISRPGSIEFQGKIYNSTEEFARCLSCGKDFDMLGLSCPLKAVYEAYRQERGFPTGTQIAELREKLHKSPAQFAAMLNTSKTTVMLYERGALPSEEHGKILAAAVAAVGDTNRKDGK